MFIVFKSQMHKENTKSDLMQNDEALDALE